MPLVEDTLYKRAQNFTLFKKQYEYLRFEDDFIEPTDLDLKCLYFNKMNDDACREVTTGRIFYRDEENGFINDESGLYFYMRSFVESSMDEFTGVCNNKKYIEQVSQLFDKYIELNNQKKLKR